VRSVVCQRRLEGERVFGCDGVMARGDASAVVEVASSHAVNSPSLDVGDVRAGRKLVVDGRVEQRALADPTKLRQT